MRGTIKGMKDARVFMDEAELCREYFKTDRLTFGMSELPANSVGGMDYGHAEADEVFFCMQGHVLVYFPEEDRYYELEKGEALLIPQGNGHRLFNNWDEKAIVLWACAPHQ